MNIPAVNIEAAGDQRPLDASAQLLQFYADIADTLPGSRHAAIRTMRDEAIAGFAAKGLPHRRIEEWKYTDLRRLMSEAYAPDAERPGITAATIEAALGELARIDAFKLVFVNGALQPKLSDIGGLPKGVELTQPCRRSQIPTRMAARRARQDQSAGRRYRLAAQHGLHDRRRGAAPRRGREA